MSDTQAIRLVDHLDDVDGVDDVIPELQSTDSDDESDGEADSDNEPDGKEVIVIDVEVAAAVEDVVTHPAYKKIKFILKEPTDFSAYWVKTRVRVRVR